MPALHRTNQSQSNTARCNDKIIAMVSVLAVLKDVGQASPLSQSVRLRQDGGRLQFRSQEASHAQVVLQIQ
eukprot:6257517-Amphidinium_carterae.1